ncbi:MAG: PCP reductase family protein [Candidatus Eisenbacteria bacterium]|nr:PCP reductase family protein [Candidatus Eisenbacteria bacterium]
MEWTPEASDKFKVLLGEIPVFMRPLAEKMGRNEVAKVAATRGVSQVDMATMVIGLVKATPAHLKDQMKEAMAKHGIRLADYEEQP